MRTLKDVYIKVTHGNISDLRVLLTYRSLDINYNLIFNSDDPDSFDFCETNSLLNRERVSLSELKRLIDTIPTREEITRLKRQISAYKTNYDKVVKHSLSKEDVIEDLQRKLNRERSKTADLFKQRKEVQLNHCKQIRTLAQEVERVKSLYDDVLKKLDIQADLIRDKNAQIEQLKQRKWWQIWK